MGLPRPARAYKVPVRARAGWAICWVIVSKRSGARLGGRAFCTDSRDRETRIAANRRDALGCRCSHCCDKSSRGRQTPQDTAARFVAKGTSPRMERIMRALVFTALAALFWLPLTAHAQDPANSPPPQPPPRVGQACRADIQSFCPNIAPGPARHTCIMTNMSKMSAGCQAAFTAMQGEAGDMHRACGPDIRQYCASATGPARRQCIEQNLTKFTPDCQTAMAQLRGGGQPPAAAAPPPQ